MHEIKESININATPAKVWSLLTDLPSWKTWNTFVINAETMEGGELKVGTCQVLTVATKPDAKPSVFNNEVSVLVPEKELVWVGKIPYFPRGFFEGIHWCTLEPLDGGTGCLFTQAEKMTGALVPIIKLASISEDLRIGYKRMNRELKVAAELL
ncbi:hypothetical protein BKA56DRAFT_606195 [Ilyonectria sp. MPI-CAGE-AT-0026]|nr:hypothetical protein BKA56DRAFT_606195 [Ilyonectria sp. MPI-CAGE-AT-0026]